MTALVALQEELGLLNDMATARTIGAQLAGGGAAARTAPSCPTPEEAGHLAEAEAHFRRLLKAGTFWRGASGG
jgi:hypothetical protein